MRVSWRHMLAGAGVATLAATAALSAIGQSCNTCAPPPAPPPPPPSSGCCQTPRNLVVQMPGVNVATANVHVGATSMAVASAQASSLASGIAVAGAGAGGNASAGAGAFFGSGGGYYSNPGVAQSTISGLSVEGGYETRRVEEDVVGYEEICVDKIVEEFRTRPVQALCIDDRNTPHPASRVDDEMAVMAGYTGELYRCMAGTRMQVTLGEMVNGAASFERGETFSCAKGEALVHTRSGQLQCRTQRPERDCNERSLLRKFGPGIKLVNMPTQKMICEPATRQTVTRVVRDVKVPVPATMGNLVLDGGVGQGY